MPIPYSFTSTAFRGLDKTSGIEQLPPRPNKPEPAMLSVAESVTFTEGGGVAGRKGYEEVSDMGTSAKVDTLKVHEFQNVMFGKSGTKIHSGTKTEWDNDNSRDIGDTRTAGEREFFHPFQKNMYATNQTDGFTRIAVSTLATAITANSSTTVSVRAGDGSEFTNGAATIYIEGDDITATSRSGDDITVTASTITSDHAVGAIITEVTDPANAPKGSWISDIKGSLLVGGVGARASTIHASAPSSDPNPELAYDFTAANGAVTHGMPSDTVGAATGQDRVLIGMKRGIQYTTGFDNIGQLKTFSAHEIFGIPNAFCIVMGESNFYILTNEGRVLEVGDTNEGFRVRHNPKNERKSFDWEISEFVRKNRDADQSLASLHYDHTNQEVIANIVINGILKEFVHQLNIGSWSEISTKNHATKAIFQGTRYAGSDNDAKVYKDNTGILDGLIDINCRIVTGIYRLGEEVTGDWLKLNVHGLLGAAGEFRQRVLIDGEIIINELVEATDMVTKNQMESGGSGVPIGGGQIGAQAIGSSGDVIEGFKFKRPTEFMAEGENAQIELEFNPDCEIRYISLFGEHEGELLVTTS